MDLKKWFTNNKWFILAMLYIIAMIFQFSINQWGFVTTPAGIGLIIAFFTTIMTNFKPIKKLLRKIKFFIGFSMFKWEAQAAFSIKCNTLKSTVVAEEEKILELLLSSLKKNKEKSDKNAVRVSYSKNRNLILTIKKYVIDMEFSLIDLDEIDDDGDEVRMLKIDTIASLRFKDSREAIEGILLDFYHLLCEKYEPSSEKYTFTIEPEEVGEDYLKKIFINEYDADEITAFEIRKNSPQIDEFVTHKNINFVTKRRDQLKGLVECAILRLS
ncbi:hypothetical protein MOE70_11785 [Bacillus licheniformis]|uniref:hypothetical protein n=1 Tax=Bacillus licheniformis TaxID=1402 RepID=UPI0022803461|nr:hypothetical protein [Bacillus licheniformis]MCY7774047.1 hypothetical protein [Bacillus licheniformis]MCY8531160.1 hypothetical protein [Bacillus licheniformis]MCY9284875.1 hypothetical protein [Bacillus licheniformis]MEC1389072.1 hypothetical protein [Bacillus licheniformis]